MRPNIIVQGRSLPKAITGHDSATRMHLDLGAIKGIRTPTNGLEAHCANH